MSFRIEDKLFIFHENLSQFNEFLNNKLAKKIFELELFKVYILIM